MTSIQAKIKRMGDALAAAIPNTYHYWRPQRKPPFCVWAETGEPDGFQGDNRKGEQAISGTVDYYTQTEYDPAVDTIQETLNSFPGPLGWTLVSVEYEDETNMIHFSWDWKMG